MLKIFNRLRELDKKLSAWKEQKKIYDYRLILKLNMSVNLYIKTDNMSDAEIESLIGNETIDIDVEKITSMEFAEDDYYSSLFKNTQPLDLGLRRSLSNIIEYDNDDEELQSCPIVLFYSYKGGVGRTTALALFATYYAFHSAKKIFIIDCDFEAPGLINFYDISNEELPKNGIVEYILDKIAYSEISLRDSYVYEVSKRYSGDGEINLLPAGNIFAESDRWDYLEALARLDLHGTSTIVKQFKEVILDINKEYKPDVILIDSRTGFNDVFGIIAHKLANIIVGLFGNNTQNRPGLHFCLDTLLHKKSRNVNLILVLALISTSFSNSLKAFENVIEDYIQNNISDDINSSLPALPIFALQRHPSLEKVGTDEEDPEDFIALMVRKMLSDYQELFLKLEQQLSNFSADKTDTKKFSHPDQPSLKVAILKQLDEHFPEPYAENINFTDKFLESEFYFRKCMEDIFNHSKFLLIGGKGTGKTAFYQALRKEVFFNNLIKRAQKQHIKYQVINIISLAEDPEPERIKFIDTAANFNQEAISDPEYFYRRFWTVFIWNAIRLDDAKTGFKSQAKQEINPILNNSATATFLHKCIVEENIFDEIETELQEFDKFLSQNDKYCMIIFDRLDQVVKPARWSKAISPLIRYCQTHNFKRILPKLLVRRDLFNKLGNLTNKESLEKQTINLEWNKEELYAFFFKIIFAHSKSKKDFFAYLRSIDFFSEGKLKEIEQKLNKKNSYNQLPPDEYLLRPLVEVFFGKRAESRGNYEMYDWIHKNLMNADRTISLRPFLDLIKYAIKEQQKNPHLNNKNYPILSPKCFNAEVRKQAVTRHFEDLAKEEGNEALSIIISDIKDDRISRELKVSPLFQNNFERLLKEIIKQHNELKDKSLKELEDTLVLNGIIFFKYIPGGRKQYTFAYLYKYYLGLRSPKERTINT
jgi:cellulose biosynthesis protein BcsQ/GTPase SAR1 family protein